MPLEPRISVPMPMMSTMLPYSLFVGAKSNSSASVAALMNFIVTIGVRKTRDAGLLARPRAGQRGGFDAARDDEARDGARAERAAARARLLRR